FFSLHAALPVSVFEIPWLRQSVVAHNLSYSCITLVPADILAIYASSCLPVFPLYISLTLSITSGTRSACTRLIVHPPKPPPIILAPRTAPLSRTASTKTSSSAQLTSQRRCSPSCASNIRLPNPEKSSRLSSSQASCS